MERQPQAPKAHTPRLRKLPAPRTPSPHLGSEHWCSSQGQILQHRLLGRMARTPGQAGVPEETRQEKWSPIHHASLCDLRQGRVPLWGLMFPHLSNKGEDSLP